MKRADFKRPGGALAIVIALLTVFEGVRYVAYKDVAGVPTICAGHTEGVVMGMTATKKMCDELLSKEGQKFMAAVDKRVTADMEPWQLVALSLFSYNMGIGAFEGSTMLKLANQRQWVAACHELPKWNKARKGRGGPKVVWPGLVKRRTQEMFICLGYIFDDEFSPNHRTRKPLL